MYRRKVLMIALTCLIASGPLAAGKRPKKRRPPPAVETLAPGSAAYQRILDAQVAYQQIAPDRPEIDADGYLVDRWGHRYRVATPEMPGYAETKRIADEMVREYKRTHREPAGGWDSVQRWVDRRGNLELEPAD
jgi:hypothetical protein